MNDFSPTPPQPKKSWLAIWSLAFGVLAIGFCYVAIFTIPALILGHVALSRIKRSNGSLDGASYAKGGLVLGYLSIPLMLFVSIPGFQRARDVAQRQACLNNLVLISKAKTDWATATKVTTNATPSWSDLQSFFPSNLSNGAPHCPSGGNYTIGNLQTLPTCSIPGHELDN